MPPATNTPPVARTIRPRLPATAPSTEQKSASAISHTGSVPASARWEIAAAGSLPAAASTAAVSGRISPRQAGSSERNLNTSTRPLPDRTRSHETRPYLFVRKWTRPCSSGVRAARSTWPPSDATTW